MKSIKEWNWKQIGWRILQGIIIFIINGASISFGIMKCVNVGEPVKIGEKYIQLDYLDALEFKYRIIIYLLMILGGIATFFFIKFLYKNKQANKDRDLANKQYELEQKKLEAQEKAHKELSERIERIMKGK